MVSIDIKKLKYFVAVAKTNSFTRAAELLYISQPALSRTIKNLESELGVVLFGKYGNKIYMTDAGTALYKSAEKIITEFENVTDSLYDTKNLEQGHIVVGIPPIIGVLYFVCIINSFKKLYPGITLQVIEEGADKVISRVRSEEVDIGIGIQPTQYHDLTGTLVFQDEVVALVQKDHPLTKKKFIRFEDLKDEDFHLLSKDFSLHSQMMEKCTLAGFSPKIISTSSQWDFIVKMVEMSGGVAILPRPILTNLPPSLQILSFDPFFKWEIMIWHKRNKYVSYATLAFVEEIKRWFKDDAK